MARRPWLLVLLAAVLGATAAPDWTDCPSACRCKWTSGKKTAVCKDAGLSALPATLNSDMQVLDLSGNSIPYLAKDAFRNVGLLNLQRIFMRGARLRDVHRDAFRDLLILVEVDLADNLVSGLHPDTFTGNDRLRLLCLNGNPLGELREAQFPPLPHLRTIELKNCRLTHVHRDAFVHLAALESLNLQGNQLRQLSEAVFMSTGRLNTLALDGNPWRCDCQLRGFRNWYLSSNLRTGVSLTCSEPETLAGRAWDVVSASEFACAPTVTLTGGPVRADQGGNVSFGCHVRGDPEPEVTWLYNGRVIGSGNATDPLPVIEVEEGLLEKWTNISVYNVSESDAGEYSCVARNSVGAVARNVTLVLPEVVTATTVSKADPWVLWLGVAGGGAAAALAVLGGAVAACCACGHSRRRRKRHRRKGQLKGSVSFSDQEKKLLDVSITTTDRETTCGGGGGGSGGFSRGSCEMLQADMEMLEQSPSIELCDPPVHITIESHQPGGGALLAGGGGGGGGGGVVNEQAGALPVAMFPPPPPEFSTSVLPAGAFGNIFISVSVSQDPTGLDVAARYPDLLDVARTREVPPSQLGHHQPQCAHLATLPRRQCRQVVPIVPVQYDNMGPRVTAGGSSTLSLPDAVAPPEDTIPPPPPPPACTPHTGEYVSL